MPAAVTVITRTMPVGQVGGFQQFDVGQRRLDRTVEQQAATLSQDQTAASEHGCHAQVVGADHGRLPGRQQVIDQSAGSVRVEIGGRLVEQQE